jgi:hypothetical protein
MMKEPTVIIGQLVEPHKIRTEEGDTVKIENWGGRAAWAYLRLVFSRSIDERLKAMGEHKRQDFIDNLLVNAPAHQERPLQFIMSSSGTVDGLGKPLGDVLAVATMKHLLLAPRKVYETAAEILGPAAAIQPTRNLHGETFMTSQGFAGIKVGYQVDGGDLLTRSAVRVGIFARVEMCFNPLSWLGVSGVSRFGIPADYERVLRIKKLNELFPRLKAALDSAKGKLSDLQARVDHTKGVSLSARKATVINGALCMAYGLGEKVINQVMERYEQEPKTQYGLAMAQSWTAEHGEHRATPQGRIDRVPQSLSTISGATLLIDPKTAEPKIRAWLGQQKSTLATDLLKGKLP